MRGPAGSVYIHVFLLHYNKYGLISLTLKCTFAVFASIDGYENFFPRFVCFRGSRHFRSYKKRKNDDLKRGEILKFEVNNGRPLGAFTVGQIYVTLQNSVTTIVFVTQTAASKPDINSNVF